MSRDGWSFLFGFATCYFTAGIAAWFWAVIFTVLWPIPIIFKFIDQPEKKE